MQRGTKFQIDTRKDLGPEEQSNRVEPGSCFLPLVWKTMQKMLIRLQAMIMAFKWPFKKR